MAYEEIDTTGNEPSGITFAKIKAMLKELYDETTDALSVAVATVAGLTTSESLKVDTGTKTATATAGAATLAKSAGKITSESLSTEAGALYTLTLTNSKIAAADQVFASVALGTATEGNASIVGVKPAAGSVVIQVRNTHASQALNGTIVVSFLVVKN